MFFESLPLLIFVLMLTIVGSLACSLTESVLLSLSPIKLETWRREGRSFAAGWLRLKKNVERPISAILIINTICNTGGATLAGTIFSGMTNDNPQAVFFFTAGLTLAILYVSEIIPKTAGALFAEKLAPLLLAPLEISIIILSPLITFSQWLTRLIRRVGREQSDSRLTHVDIEVITQMARAHNAIAGEQESIIVNAAKMRETLVKEIMIPVNWMVFFRLDRPVVDNLRLGQHAMHTRYPVSTDGDPNNIHGYINYKDLIGFREHGNDLNLEAFIRPIVTLAENDNLTSVLRRLSAKRYHIALVKNAEGNVSGMITLEDVIEELVGDIEDEFDLSVMTVIPITEGVWRVGANLAMERVEAVLGRKFPNVRDGETLSQWLNRRLPPQHYPGVSAECEGVRFIVQQARRGKIFQVVLELVEDQAPAGWSAAGM